MALASKQDFPKSDIHLIQAVRLELGYMKRALANGSFNPFPDGGRAYGEPNNNNTEVLDEKLGPDIIGSDLIRTVDGSLPDYIIDSMYALLNDDDTSLYDFLGIFDKRFMRLFLQFEKTKILVSSQDFNQTDQFLLPSLLKFINRPDGDFRSIALLTHFLQGNRSLGNLENIILWLTGQKVKIHATFKKKIWIDDDALTSLSSLGFGNNGLGLGSLLGQRCISNMGSIVIEFSCATLAELKKLESSSDINDYLPSLLKQYFRNDVQITIFANINRKLLQSSKISVRNKEALKLGEYNCLSPKLDVEKQHRIKILDIRNGKL